MSSTNCKSLNCKTLWLVRHAKSSWDSDAVTDHERPLNKRGLNDAPMMGQRLASRQTSPQVIICSSAKRAQMTANLIASEIGYDQNQIEIESDIYAAGVMGLVNIIQNLDNELNEVMLVGHNPTITEMVNMLTGSNIDNCPTCSIAKLQINSDSSVSWHQFSSGSAELVEFDTPKNRPS